MKIRYAFASIIPLLFTPVNNSYAGYNEAVSAYERGEYTQALTELFSFFKGKNINVEYQQWKQKIDAMGLPKNYDNVIPWLEKRALQGSIEAQYYLGIMYRDGLGVVKSPALAQQWLEKAAQQGNSNAMIYMGEIYTEGLGVSPDIILAYAWLTLAEEHLTDNDGKQLVQQSRQTLASKMSPLQLKSADDAIRILKQQIAN